MFTLYGTLWKSKGNGKFMCRYCRVRTDIETIDSYGGYCPTCSDCTFEQM